MFQGLTSYTKAKYNTKGKMNIISLLFSADKAFEKSRFLQSEQDFGDVWDAGVTPSSCQPSLSILFHSGKFHSPLRSVLQDTLEIDLRCGLDRLFVLYPLSTLHSKEAHLSAHFLQAHGGFVSLLLLPTFPGPISHRDTHLHKQMDMPIVIWCGKSHPTGGGPLGGKPSSCVKNTRSGWKRHQERCTEWSRGGKSYPHWPSSPTVGFLKQEHWVGSKPGRVLQPPAQTRPPTISFEQWLPDKRCLKTSFVRHSQQQTLTDANHSLGTAVRPLVIFGVVSQGHGWDRFFASSYVEEANIPSLVKKGLPQK